MKRFFLEPLFVLAVILLALKLAQIFFPPAWVGLLAPLLLLYVPVLLSWRAQQPFDFVDRSYAQFLKGFGAFALMTLLVFPPYVAVAHYWMLKIFHFQSFRAASWLTFGKPWFYQLLVVALPEEFFFRGYFQSRLNQYFKPRWRFLGISFGWGLILTALIFAFAHSVIQLKWWHFSIFFPGLLFGYLKERTGSITAPVLFHAFSNCFTVWFLQSYLR